MKTFMRMKTIFKIAVLLLLPFILIESIIKKPLHFVSEVQKTIFLFLFVEAFAYGKQLNK
jgi:inner membrane protein involved in colicin E2 resistance